MHQPSRVGAHAAVALTILESLRHLDAPAEDGGPDEFHEELSVKRFGMSETVAAQIERYRLMAGRGGRVEFEEVAALFRLVGRRSDAGLVFADAGRRVGRRVVRALRGRAALVRVLPGFARNRLAFRLARGAARTLDADMIRDARGPSAVISDPPSAAATPNGAGCGFYGSALAEILRELTDFDGALFHTRCRSRGEPVCEWSAS